MIKENFLFKEQNEPEDWIETLIENDSISPEEEGFMRGYFVAS